MERNLGQWALRGYGMFAVDVADGTASVGPACCIRWNGRNRSWPIRSIARSGDAA